MPQMRKARKRNSAQPLPNLGRSNKGSLTPASEPQSRGGKAHHGSDSSHNPDYPAVGSSSGLAVQQKLGLWPERRTRSASGDRDHPLAHAGVLTQDASQGICSLIHTAG